MPHIAFHAHLPPLVFEDGILVWDRIGPKQGAREMTTGVAVFGPGKGVKRHYHNCEETVTIIAGRAYCEVGGQRYLLMPYDTSFIEAGVPHRFLNASASEPMVMVFSYSRADVTRTIVPDEDGTL